MRTSAPVVIAMVLWTGCGASGSSAGGEPGAAPGAPASPSAPPAMPSPREVHGFPIPSSFTHVCSQHTTLAGAGMLSWDLYASTEEVRDVVTFYREHLRSVTPQEDPVQAGGGRFDWRLPNEMAPEHVLTVYAPGRTGMPSCGTEPPTTTRSLANLSTMTRP